MLVQKRFSSELSNLIKLFFIGILFCSFFKGSKSENQKHAKESIKQNFKKEAKKENLNSQQTIKTKIKDTGLKSTKTCDIQGSNKKLIASNIRSAINVFPNKSEVNFLIDQLLEASKNKTDLCPSHCNMVNNYSLLGNIDFLSVNKNSCPKKERKEIYHLKKQWSMKKRSKKILLSSYDDMLEWMLEVFLYPFASPNFFSEEHHPDVEKYKIKSACPSCSFIFSYTFSYKEPLDGKIDFNITASCSDKRKMFSKVKREDYFLKEWNCVEKK
ncbi:MAG: hypothetical protein GDA46_05410 [Bdellovibrionales bacterium]|nr:hypothetical protein [Bdellovibrionales bacterium]